MKQIPVALQLYTVRELLAEDYAGTLRKAKAIGYDFVQLTGQLPYEAPQMAALLADIGLGVAGIHVRSDALEADLDHWIAYGKAVGTQDLVCPWLAPERLDSVDACLASAATLEELGSRCKAAGMRLSYHNHSHEFVRLEGRYALDILYENTSPDNLYAEIDTYWVKLGGAAPVAYVRKYAARMPILHIKDMAADEDRSFAEIGNGILDWQAICEAAEEGIVEFYCVEQDRCAGDPLESARISCEFMQQLLSG